MLLSRIKNDGKNIIYVLCMGNINIQDTSLFNVIQPNPPGIVILNPKTFNVNIKLPYKDYHEKHLIIKKPILLSDKPKIKAINDLTYTYRNINLTTRSFNGLHERIKHILDKIQNENAILIIVYDDYITKNEKQLLRYLFTKDLKWLEQLNLKAIVFHHNSESNYYVFKMGDKIHTNIINIILNKHVDKKENKEKYEVTSEIPVRQIKLSKVTSILTDIDQLPKQKRSELYDKLTDMIIDIFKTLGLNIIDIHYENINNVADINGSIVRRYSITFKLPHGETDQIEFDVPEMVGDSYFFINGTRRALQYQMINNPIIVVKPGQVKLHTLYSSVTLQKTGKKSPVYKLYAGGLNLNPILVFLAQNRLQKFAELFGVDVRFEPN